MSKTRLFEAVKSVDLVQAKAILRAKPGLLTVWNEQGRNLLHLACSADCKKLKKPESAAAKMVAYLLDAGLDIEKEGGSGPDLTGYGSREWLVAFISNPSHSRFYGTRNDRMPAFGEEKILTPQEVGLVTDWIRREWYEPAQPKP